MEALVVNRSTVPVDLCTSTLLQGILATYTNTELAVLYSQTAYIDFKKSTFLNDFKCIVRSYNTMNLLVPEGYFEMGSRLTALLNNTETYGYLFTGTTSPFIIDHPDMLILHSKGYRLMKEYTQLT